MEKLQLPETASLAPHNPWARHKWITLTDITPSNTLEILRKCWAQSISTKESLRSPRKKKAVRVVTLWNLHFSQSKINRCQCPCSPRSQSKWLQSRMYTIRSQEKWTRLRLKSRKAAPPTSIRSEKSLSSAGPASISLTWPAFTPSPATSSKVSRIPRS